jgi:hypothetical protein
MNWVNTLVYNTFVQSIGWVANKSLEIMFVHRRFH